MIAQRVGGAEKIEPESAIRDAVELAARSDVTVIVVGLSAEWESEGFDRPTLSLPMRQDELISAVAKASKHTVVVLQAVSILKIFSSMYCITVLIGIRRFHALGSRSGRYTSSLVIRQ